MLDMMQKTINRNLLKYSAGRAIFCPHCGNVADYRRWVIAEKPDGTIAGQCCTTCFDAAQGDKPIPEGWIITREATPKKRKAPKLPDTVRVISFNKTKSYVIPAIKAFDMYGHSFFAHPVENSPKYWTVTHSGTGAAVCSQRLYKSKAAAIRASLENLENAGQEKFLKLASEQALP